MFDFGKYLFQKMHERESDVFWKRHFPVILLFNSYSYNLFFVTDPL